MMSITIIICPFENAATFSNNSCSFDGIQRCEGGTRWICIPNYRYEQKKRPFFSSMLGAFASQNPIPMDAFGGTTGNKGHLYFQEEELPSESSH